MKPSTLFFTLLLFLTSPAFAQQETPCTASDHTCLFETIETEAAKITESRWRNYAYRDLAVSKAMDGDYDGAITLIGKIDNADTQAMTIRAIGMAVAIHQDLSEETYRMIFKKLDGAAETITNSGAKDIAYTYIAMAEAFAGLDQDATETTANMTNPALKHKAFGETAEIQADRGDFDAAMNSINAIDSLAFKNKALGIVSGIFVKQQKYDEALKAAQAITNSTKKVEAIQKILNARQNLVGEQ